MAKRKRVRAKKRVRKAPVRARKPRVRRVRKNPAGELATILVANGGPMAKRRRRRRIRRRVGVSAATSAPRRRRRRVRRMVGKAVGAAKLVRLVRRRARRNPADSGIGGMVSDTAATTAGVLAARFAQNFSAMKLEKGAATPADAKAKAGKPLYIAIGAAVPVAIGLALKKLTKQDRIGNGFIVGGLTFAVHELARQFVFSKAPESSPFYALGEDGELGQVAQGEDGTEWALVPGRGWHRIDDLAPRALPARAQRRVGRTLDGLEVRDSLGGVELRDSLGELEPGVSGVELRDALGEEGPYVGADWDTLGGVELRDSLGAADDYTMGAPYGYGDEG